MVSVQRDDMVRKYPEGNETFFFIYFTDSTGRGLINYTKIKTVYLAKLPSLGQLLIPIQ
jgi:hypothetical protein